MNKMIASFRTSDQVGPNDWDVVTRAKIFDQRATLEEVRGWYLKECGSKVMHEVKITEDCG